MAELEVEIINAIVSDGKRYVDQSNYVFSGGVVLDQEDIVDRDGYRDTQSIIEEMLDAGIRLQEFRREEFDNEFDDLSDESLVDPTRNVGFDIIDAANLAAREAKRLSAIAKEKKEEEEKKKVEVKEEVKPPVKE